MKIIELIKSKFDITFFKFVLVGIANTLFGMGIMFAFYNLLHFNYTVSSISNYVFGSILSYFLNKYFTFKSKVTTKTEVLKFIINIAICYFVAYGVAKPLIWKIFSNFSGSLKDNIAMLVGAGIFFVLNYIGQRFFVFKAKNKEEIPPKDENIE